VAVIKFESFYAELLALYEYIRERFYPLYLQIDKEKANYHLLDPDTEIDKH